MIKYKPLPENIESLMTTAIIYLQSYNQILFAYLFGGLARGKPQPLSDVDIAVYLKPGVSVEGCKLSILGRLTDILQTDEVDLVALNVASLPLVMNILKNKKVIVDKKPFTRHIFESLVMRKYFDFAIKEKAIFQRRYFHG